jgi:hypothetical protein
VTIGENRKSKKQPLDDAGARDLLAQVDDVVIARGKSSRTQKAGDTTLDDLRGPSGGFRAPMVRVGRRLLVGFSQDALGRLLKE